jgi:integrase
VSEQRLAGDSIGRMVKRRAELAGLDPDLFGGHSLRYGFATTAARVGVAEHKIMTHQRHDLWALHLAHPARQRNSRRDDGTGACGTARGLAAVEGGFVRR